MWPCFALIDGTRLAAVAVGRPPPLFVSPSRPPSLVRREGALGVEFEDAHRCSLREASCRRAPPVSCARVQPCVRVLACTYRPPVFGKVLCVFARVAGVGMASTSLSFTSELINVYMIDDLVVVNKRRHEGETNTATFLFLHTKWEGGSPNCNMRGGHNSHKYTEVNMVLHQHQSSRKTDTPRRPLRGKSPGPAVTMVLRPGAANRPSSRTVTPAGTPVPPSGNDM